MDIKAALIASVIMMIALGFAWLSLAHPTVAEILALAAFLATCWAFVYSLFARDRE